MAKAGNRAKRPERRAHEKHDAATKREALRQFVATQSLSVASRATGVPIGTLAGWVDDPRNADTLETLRKANARAIAEDDLQIARESVEGLRLAVRKGKALLEAGLDGKETAAVGKLMLAVRSDYDRRGRLDRGESTDNVSLQLVSEEAAVLEPELRALLRDRKVRGELRRLLGDA